MNHRLTVRVNHKKLKQLQEQTGIKKMNHTINYAIEVALRKKVLTTKDKDLIINIQKRKSS